MNTNKLFVLTVVLVLLGGVGAGCAAEDGSATVRGVDQIRTEIPEVMPTLTPTPLPRNAFNPISARNVAELAVVREQQAHSGAILGAQFSSGGSLLYTFGQDGVLRRWRLADYALTAEWRIFNNSGTAVAFLGDDVAVLGGDTSQIAVINLQNGQPLRQQATPETIVSVAFVPNTDPAAPAIAVGYTSGRAQLISGAGAVEIDVSFRRGNTAVTGLAFDLDANTLITGHLGSNVVLWNAKNGDRIDRLTQNRGDVLSVLTLPDGNGFLTTGADNTMRTFDLATREQVQVFRGHQFNVAQAAFSADGTLLASTGQDGTIRVWDPANARQLFELDTNPGSAGILWTRAVRFSPDNLWLVVGDDVGVLRYLAVLDAEVRAGRDAQSAAQTATAAPDA